MFGKMHRLRTRGLEGEEGFALIYSLLIILVITGLATAILALMVAQVKPTQLAKKREQTLNTSEAGLQNVLARIRASTGAVSSAGLLSALPQCPRATNYATVSGNVGNSTDNYVANIYYTLTDPSVMTFAQVQAAAMTCSPLVAQPNFAYVVSAGNGATLPGKYPSQSIGDRTLHGVYTFSTNNMFVAGGEIKEYTANLCWDVGTNPGVGTKIVLQTCGTEPYAQQSFTYQANLTIQYTGDTNSNLCVQTPSGANLDFAVLAICAGAPTGQLPYPYAAGSPATE